MKSAIRLVAGVNVRKHIILIIMCIASGWVQQQHLNPTMEGKPSFPSDDTITYILFYITLDDNLSHNYGILLPKYNMDGS